MSTPAGPTRSAIEPANSLHAGPCTPGTGWSTTNAGEAIPGVVTPLTWSFFGERTERGTRGAFADLGVLTEAEVARPARSEDRLWDIFYGRAAANLETMRGLGDRTPGTSGDAIELQMFGALRPDAVSHPSRARYPVVAVKAPYAAARVSARLHAATGDVDRWWRACVAPDIAAVSPAEARGRLWGAADRFEAVMRPHTFVAFLCQGLYEQVRALAEAAGRPGLETSLMTGYGDMSETAYVADLWAVARGDRNLDAFIAAHGYHGPNEGELAARVWRLDRRPLERLLDSYRALPDEQDPRRMEARRSAEREAGEREVLAALPRARRTPARLVLALAGRYVPLRGTGKAAFLQCVDVARHSARILGADLVSSGRLEAADDVFLLTLDELGAATGPPPDAPTLVAERRALRERYVSLELPAFFDGTPVPTAVRTGDLRGDRTTVTGTPVCPGVVEGIARLVLDPEEDDGPDEGEILVCRTTDPSWASVMVVAAAMVIDIGGPISHGAIVARELGVPCVIGTKHGTEVIQDGDRVRVDGTSGEVVVLKRAAG